jgi:diguanylate cyclase (GGDEF)-like protein
LAREVQTLRAAPLDPAEIERLARRVVDTLLAIGAFVPIGESESGSEYQNRETGDRMTIRWRHSGPPVVRVAIPPPLGEERLAVEVVREILTLETTIFSPDERAPASASDLIRAAIRVASDLTRADFVTFHPSERGDAEVGETLPVPRSHEQVLRALIPQSGDTAVYLSDLASFDAVRKVAPRDDLRSVLFAPIRTSDGVPRGLLEAWCRRSDPFERRDVVAFALLADRFGEGLRKAAALERFVFFDRLTGLYNREFFNLQLEKEIARARRAGDSFALVIADLDDFKATNTRYGYYGANELLEQLGALFKRSIRPFDIAARWGGEEFALILTAPISRLEAIAVCNRLRETIHGHAFRTSGLDLVEHDVAMTVSIGVSFFPATATESRALWTSANGALQLAKRSGKNRVVEATGLREGP